MSLVTVVFLFTYTTAYAAGDVPDRFKEEFGAITAALGGGTVPIQEL